MPSVYTTQLLSALQQSKFATENPAAYQVMRQLILSVDGLSTDVLAVQKILTPSGGISGHSPDVQGFTAVCTKTNIKLSWDSTGLGYSYEIRIGTDWATASYVTTAVANSAILDPLPIGSYTYLIKATDLLSRYSENAASANVIIAPLGEISVTTQIISNNVLFYWTAPTSTFDIARYDIYKDSVLIGHITGTFFAYFEIAGGIYNYLIQAVDIAGNKSSDVDNVHLTLINPTDFYTNAAQIDDTFTGTKVNCLVTDLGLTGPVDISQSYADHFSTRSWATWKDQIDAGYPRFLQPAPSIATYEEVIDFGSVFYNTTISINPNQINIVGIVTLSCTLAYSTDDITYTTPAVGFNLLATAVRYVKFKLTMTPANSGYDFCRITSIATSLNILLEQDGGNLNAISTDAGGTLVAFNKVFTRVVSITVAALSTEPIYSVYDFTDIENPTGFTVMLFDSSGNRVSKLVSWKARGVV
jgi:hypothetical protein